MTKILLTGIIFSMLVSSCGNKVEKRNERIFDVNVNLENDFINIENTKKQYNAHSGDYYSGVDTSLKYGAGYVKKIDDTLRGYNLDLIVSAWVRESVAPCEGAIAVSLNGKDGSSKDWTGLKVSADRFKEKEWIHVVDTFKYKSALMNDVSEIKVFSMKSEGGDMFDVDDLRINYIFYK